MRPRNVIKMFSHAKGFAANLNHPKIGETDLEKGIRAYSQDLLVELDHELTDVFPAAKDLLYHFIDCAPEQTLNQLSELIAPAGIQRSEVGTVIDFLLYYGILGIKATSGEHQFIFDVNYDLKMLQIRAARIGDSAAYVVNPAFRPALGIREGQ